MRLRTALVAALLGLSFVSVGCTSDSQVKKTLEDNPEILFNAIEKHPKKFIDVVNKAARQAKRKAKKERMAQQKQRRKEAFENPKEADIKSEHVVFGNEEAPITIVEYSDFQCPYCRRGFKTVKKVKKEYGDQVKVVYKHLPLDFHPLAMPAAKYFQAVAMQSEDKAEKFHDLVFKNQDKLKEQKKDYLKTVAKKVGADMGQLKKDIASEKVKKLISADKKEAKKFGFSGTPGYLINGVPLKGAQPFKEFKKVIDRHLEEQS